MPGSLAAREISKSYAAVQVLDRVSLVVSPGRPHRHRRPERDRQVDPAPRARGARGARRRPDRPRRRGRLPAAGAGGARAARRCATTSRAAPASARPSGEMDALAARLDAEPELRARTRRRSTGTCASAARTSTPAPARCSTDVGLGRRAERELATLSGGEAARAALAAILLARFDVFLLDEPTNNLDFAGLDRLERFLDGLDAGVVLVSHDRAFLDRTVTRVVELEAETRQRAEYAGGWSDYEAARERARGAARGGVRRLRRRARPLHRVARRPARIRGARGRRDGGSPRRRTRCAGRSRRRSTTSSGSRWSTSRGARGGCSCGSPRRRRRRLHRGARRRASSRSARSRSARSTSMLGYGDRLAVVGPNGSGKTTLIRALTGALPLAPASGGSARGTVFGELNQARDLFAGVLLDDFARAVRTRDRPTRARCSRSSRSAPTTSTATPPRSRRASARAPGSRCSRRAASTA